MNFKYTVELVDRKLIEMLLNVSFAANKLNKMK